MGCSLCLHHEDHYIYWLIRKHLDRTVIGGQRGAMTSG